ncbi:MAG: tyrosine--tRNA ligase [Candidatus Marinimicrobia bacterium]|nr:tyrosine--tRNA ligase [Candidatus Neomarinimicrobiota bacterium]
MSKFPPVNEQIDLIRRGVDEIIPEDDLVIRLEKSISSGKPLIVKLGCDPSRPDLHIGHAVVLRKLRHFQDLGHQAVLVIGDFTAMIGDPSGRNKTRPQLTIEEVRGNGKTYVDQASAILNIKTLRIVYNSEWLSVMSFQEVIKLASHYTVARMLERDDFEKRYKNNTPISIHEFLYPLAQAMDSVQLKADVELGGTDQKFNLLVGRDLQRDYGQNPQLVITTPLLEGTDGVKKMSKSYDNYIGITENPNDMYGKTMSVPDHLIAPYFECVTDINQKELEKIKMQLSDKSGNPRDLKRKLARAIVSLYHTKEAAIEAEKHFDQLFIHKGLPDEIDTYKPSSNPVQILNLMVDSGLVTSKREARRLIEQGAVKINGEKITDINFVLLIDQEVVLKVGKRRFLKVIV